MEKRIHVIPLRKEFLKTSSWRRAGKAVKALKKYVWKHYRTDEVRVGKHLNEKLWERGSKHPPSKVKVVAVKEKEKVFLELEDKYEEPKKEVKKKEKPVTAEKGAEEKKEVKKEEKVEEKKEKKAPVKKKTSKK